jgi:hypothetical protein
VALASPIDPATGQPAEHASHGLFTVSPAAPKPPAAHKAPAAATKQTPAQAQTPPAQAQTPPAQAQTPAPAPKPKPKLNVPPSPPVPPLETITIPWNGPDGKPLTEQALQALINNQSSFVNVTNVGPPPDKASSAPGTFPATKDPLLEGIDLANAIVAQFEPTAPLSLLAPNEFNLLCLPDISIMEFDIQAEAIAAALLFCEENDAFFIVDPPPPDGVSADLKTPVGKVGVPAGDGIKNLTSWAQPLLTPKHVFGATYYPWVQIVDTVTGQPRWMPPSGAIAGVYAATDAARGWWKAPAGIDAGLEGVTGLADPTLNDTVNGQLYSMGINCLRTFPLFGSIVWGARTLAGSTLGQSPFKYVNVRRAANFIELSLQQSLRWAVFEDNDEGLWASIRVEVETFMAGLLAVGAVEAFTVACDATTTSVVDQLNGVVNVNVGFVPARPVEFVMLNVQIQAGPPAAS